MYSVHSTYRDVRRGTCGRTSEGRCRETATRSRRPGRQAAPLVAAAAGARPAAARCSHWRSPPSPASCCPQRSSPAWAGKVNDDAAASMVQCWPDLPSLLVYQVDYCFFTPIYRSTGWWNIYTGFEKKYIYISMFFLMDIGMALT